MANLQSSAKARVDHEEERSRSYARVLEVGFETQLPSAHLFVARLDHRGPERSIFRRQGIYWLDLCLTPRGQGSSVRYCDHWSPNRHIEMGAIMALLPRKRLELRTAEGRHSSLICQLKSEAVERWFPPDFVWTDRRLEAALNITSESIRSLLLRLNQEIRNPRLGSDALCEAIAAQLSIEVARYFVSVSDPDERGGLATWRQRIIDERVAEEGAPPAVSELAGLCRISARQLRRGFKASRGCSISDYLAQARIQSAKRRLSTDESIREIACSLGFASQSSFTSAFRRATGTTPSRFRQQLVEEKEA